MKLTMTSSPNKESFSCALMSGLSGGGRCNPCCGSADIICEKFLYVPLMLTFDLKSELVTDTHEISFWEYFLKYQYYTTDLTLLCARRLASEASLDLFKETSRSIGGSSGYSAFDVSHISPIPSQGFFDHDQVWNVDKFKFISSKQPFLFPINHSPPPTSVELHSHSMIIFKLCLGQTMHGNLSNCDEELPENVDSMVIQTSSDPLKMMMTQSDQSTQSDQPTQSDQSSHTSSLEILMQWVCLKFPKLQAIPWLYCQVDFRPMRIQTTIPICDLCEMKEAEFWCPNDQSHFCTQCDTTHHTSTPLIARHKRVSVSHSPHLFGNCSKHPTALVTQVCMSCHQLLCSNCAIMGVHALADKSTHPQISTIECFSIAADKEDSNMQSLYNENLARMTEFDTKLHDVLGHYKSLASQIEQIEKEGMNAIDSHTNDYLNFLESLTRSFLLEDLMVTQIKLFIQHVSKTLSPVRYLYLRHKFNTLIQSWYGQTQRYQAPTKSHISVLIPSWKPSGLVVSGFLDVRPADSPEVPFHLWYPGNEKIHESFKENEISLLNSLEEPLANVNILPFDLPGTIDAAIPSKSSPAISFETEDTLVTQLQITRGMMNDLWDILGQRHFEVLVKLLHFPLVKVHEPILTAAIKVGLKYGDVVSLAAGIVRYSFFNRRVDPVSLGFFRTLVPFLDTQALNTFLTPLVNHVKDELTPLKDAPHHDAPVQPDDPAVVKWIEKSIDQMIVNGYSSIPQILQFILYLTKRSLNESSASPSSAGMSLCEETAVGFAIVFFCSHILAPLSRQMGVKDDLWARKAAKVVAKAFLMLGYLGWTCVFSCEPKNSGLNDAANRLVKWVRFGLYPFTPIDYPPQIKFLGTTKQRDTWSLEGCIVFFSTLSRLEGEIAAAEDSGKLDLDWSLHETSSFAANMSKLFDLTRRAHISVSPKFRPSTFYENRDNPAPDVPASYIDL